MKSLKVWLFAGVFAIAAIFTLNANAGNTTDTADCWTDLSKVGQHGQENEFTSNCKLPEQRLCCYIVNPANPDESIELKKPNTP